MIKPFDEPIYVTRPLLPPLEAVHRAAGRDLGGALADQHRRPARAARGAPSAPISTSRRSRCSTTAPSRCWPRVRALGMRGEVITTPFTFPATPHAHQLERGDAGVLRHRPGHADPRPGAGRGSHHAADHRHPGGARLRHSLRRGGAAGDGRSPRPEAGLRRRARVRHARSTASASARSATPRCSAFTRPSCFTRAEGGALTCADAASRERIRPPEELRHPRPGGRRSKSASTAR